MLTFVQCAGHLVRMAHKKTDFIASLAKGLRVIETFGPDRPRQSVAEAAEAAGLDRATARRCLLTLRELGYADHDGKHFQLTARVLRLGMGALSALPLPQIVQPWLDQLSDQIGQSASVSVLVPSSSSPAPTATVATATVAAAVADHGADDEAGGGAGQEDDGARDFWPFPTTAEDDDDAEREDGFESQPRLVPVGARRRAAADAVRSSFDDA